MSAQPLEESAERCRDCGQGPYLLRPRPVVVQEGDRVAVVTEVPYLRCSVCGEEWIRPKQGVAAAVLLNRGLRDSLFSVRTFENISDRNDVDTT